MAANTEARASIDDLDALNVLSHPLSSVFVSKLRDVNTSCSDFRSHVATLTLLLGTEASRCEVFLPWWQRVC